MYYISVPVNLGYWKSVPWEWHWKKVPTRSVPMALILPISVSLVLIFSAFTFRSGMLTITHQILGRALLNSYHHHPQVFPRSSGGGKDVLCNVLGGNALLPLQQPSFSQQPSSSLFLSYNSATLPSPTQHDAYTCNIYPHVSSILTTGWMFSSVNCCGVVLSHVWPPNFPPSFDTPLQCSSVTLS